MIVAVAFESVAGRRPWVDRLDERLPGMTVLDADEVDPERVDVVVVANPPGSSLAAFTAVRLIQSTWAGVDQLVVGAPDVPIARMVAPELADAMVEFVTMGVQMLHRDIPRYLRDQRASRWEPRLQRPASDYRVGVLGFGELGEPVAAALANIGFDVTAWVRGGRKAEVRLEWGEDGLQRLLGSSDVVVNLLPLTADTAAILDAGALAAMKQGASLINVARGAHVVEEDLVDALDRGHLSDALLDVFVDEPLPAGHIFWSHPRVMVFPHVAALSDPDVLADRVADNIRLLASGQRPLHVL